MFSDNEDTKHTRTCHDNGC